MISLAAELRSRMTFVQKTTLAIGLACLAASFVAAARDPSAFYPSYLFSYVFWLGLTLGSMAVLMVHYQVGGSWGFVTRRILEAGMLTLPLMIVLFVPLLFGLRTLFPWARPEAGADPQLRHLRPYMSFPFFTLRAAVYFAIWAAFISFLVRGSAWLDHGGGPPAATRLRRLSGPGLLVYSVTVFFASADWVMSTEPRWASTVYGMIYLASQALSAFALATAVLVLLASAPPLSAVATASRLNDLGNLLLTAVMLWAYVSFSQYLIIWAENLPREISWYVHRTSPGWRSIALLLILFHFGAPFVLLLFRGVKRNRGWIAGVAWGLLALRLLDDYWRVIPAFRPQGLEVRWTDFTATAGIGGLWIALFIEVLKRRSMLPLHDPEFEPVLAEARAHA